MFKLSPLMLGLIAPLSVQAFAQNISGQIQDQNGAAIANATISVMGSQQAVKSDQFGKFTLQTNKSSDVELHITASGFAHKNQLVKAQSNGASTITVNLNASVMEVIDVKASPFHSSSMESSMPVSVLSGDALREQQAATLGDTLSKQVGVHTSFHAKVASTPVIRGLSGPRVLITQNSLDVSDASRVGPDHSVASESITATQVEVLRGPATLFYGSGAIGGVVNVVDERVPTSSDTRGEFLVERATGDDQKLAAINLNTGTGNLALHLDGFVRESNDYEIPVPAELGKEPSKTGDYTVENSAEDSHGATIGTSYLFEQGYIGVSYGKMAREYGIPGHSHGDEAPDVYADLDQDRWQLIGKYSFDNTFLSEANFRAAYTDYEHSEIEHGEVGTIFANESQEARLDIMHQPIADWRGGLSVHFKRSDFSAQGAEAFTPPSVSTTFALALMEERHFGDVLVQLGARVERVTLDAPNVFLSGSDLQADEHDGDDHDHDHDHSQRVVDRKFDVDHEFTPVSISAGAVWDYQPGYNIGVSVSRAERAPAASELFSFGPHIGTGTYEVGALFRQKQDSLAFELNPQDIDLERSHNLDITWRKLEGDFGFVLNAFYNKIDNYYYQTNTGLMADDDHDHDHDHGHDDEHNETEHEAHGLPVYVFKTDDVTTHGFEAELAWQATDALNATLFADLVRARLNSGANLPMVSPVRFGTKLSYNLDMFTVNLDVVRYQKQTHIAEHETATSGYTLVDASLNYDFSALGQDWVLYLKGHNLTDTEARVHTSFLKDKAPMPGRSFALGFRGYF
ncbi:TonB-dependent receptor [Pseudoalteromonas luteoviolacea]|uniref:TonB-dependent receptor n=1 Tax=Pseudoalteromonas luteoviolacea TaxID=43657 RepID=UPI001B399C06|nr:TonB-dependent receptor [Pseudoalteromonas luteoviolacea]MBQ4811533.1 TonB-dependent receptor [Pseudoalteromonas luteoviolacea]